MTRSDKMLQKNKDETSSWSQVHIVKQTILLEIKKYFLFLTNSLKKEKHTILHNLIVLEIV